MMLHDLENFKMKVSTLKFEEELTGERFIAKTDEEKQLVYMLNRFIVEHGEIKHRSYWLEVDGKMYFAPQYFEKSVVIDRKAK